MKLITNTSILRAYLVNLEVNTSIKLRKMSSIFGSGDDAELIRKLSAS